MSIANQELAKTICAALRDEKLFTPDVSTRFEKIILSGKTKPEDWQNAIEESHPAGKTGSQHGS